MAHARALVEADILRWARASSGLDLDEAAQALGTSTENVELWEAGESQPSMPQLRNMARVYKRRLSDFYLPGVPQETPLPHDFRRLPGEVANVYSKELRFELRAANERREIALDLYEELGEEPPEFDTSIARWDRAETTGDLIRGFLGIGFEHQSTWRQSRTHYNAWRSSIERRGILVFQTTTVDKDEMLGFSFGDKRPLPVIGINRKLGVNGRTFTMLHELTHVLIGQPSLCDIDEEVPRPSREQKTEVFCNAVAAAALMPERHFLPHPILTQHGPGKENWRDYEIEELSHVFGGSREAVVRRLLTFNRTTRDFYLKKRAQYRIATPREPDPDMRRNMPTEVIANLGRTFTRLIVDTYSSDRLSLSDVSRFLGLRASQVGKVQALIGA